LLTSTKPAFQSREAASSRGDAAFVLVPGVCNIVLSKGNKNIEEKKILKK
jgi:hypothetical protein